jgi:hypothetical protein
MAITRKTGLSMGIYAALNSMHLNQPIQEIFDERNKWESRNIAPRFNISAGEKIGTFFVSF